MFLVKKGTLDGFLTWQSGVQTHNLHRLSQWTDPVCRVRPDALRDPAPATRIRDKLGPSCSCSAVGRSTTVSVSLTNWSQWRPSLKVIFPCFSMDTVIYTSLVCTTFSYWHLRGLSSLCFVLFFDALRHAQPNCMCGEFFKSFANMDSIVFTRLRPECRSKNVIFFPKVLFNTWNVSWSFQLFVVNKRTCIRTYVLWL